MPRGLKTKFSAKYGVPAGAAVILLIWWAALPRETAPVERALIIPRGAPGAVPDQPGVPKADPAPAVETASSIEPPAPTLRHALERRFSNPDGAVAAIPPGTAAAAHLRSGANMSASIEAPPSGFGSAGSPASVAAGGSGAASPGRDGSGRDAGGPAGADPKGGAGSGGVPGAGAPGDAKLTGSAANLVSAAQNLKARGDAAAMRAESSNEAGIMRQLALDNKVDSGIRKAIADLQSSGRPVTPEAVAKAAEGVLKDNGLKPEDVDLNASIARASAPPSPPLQPADYANAAKAISNLPPLDPIVRDEIIKLNANPPPPRIPAPRGAVDAYTKNEAVLKQTERDFGVKPEHVLGILGVETTYGHNTGKYPVPQTLAQIALDRGPDGNPSRKAQQAMRDQAALVRLSKNGELGGYDLTNIKGSYAGAIGVPQFLPTSWEAYARAPSGGPRDPFNFGTASYSVGNYLRLHGYNSNVAGSIYGYNHSQEYVNKVLGVSADVKASLNALPPK